MPHQIPLMGQYWRLYSGFLKITVSPLCNGAKFSWLCAEFWDLYVQTGKIMIFFIFLYFFLSIFTYFVCILRFFCPYSCVKFSQVKLWRHKKSTFRVSAHTLGGDGPILTCQVLGQLYWANIFRSTSNRIFWCFSFIIALVQRNSQTVEIKWGRLDGKPIRNQPCTLGRPIWIPPCILGWPIRIRPCVLGRPIQNFFS